MNRRLAWRDSQPGGARRVKRPTELTGTLASSQTPEVVGAEAGFALVDRLGLASAFPGFPYTGSGSGVVVAQLTCGPSS